MSRFGYLSRVPLSFVIGDPGADDRQIHLFKAPAYSTILNAWIQVAVAQGAGSAGEFMLQNWGTVGTSIKASGGTIAAALGGTAAASRLSADTPTAFTISAGELAEGEWVVLDYQETGDWTEGAVSVHFDLVVGDAGTS
jgi:hypothetical protein